MKLFKMLTKKQWKMLFFIALGGVFVLSILPNGGGIDTGWDKANHFIAFFTLSLLLNRASSTINARIRNMIALISFGVFIEVVQSFLEYRSADWHDVIADSVGIMVFQLSLSLYRAFKEFRSQTIS